ncbi:Growth hormone-inducible transmembrane protein isoform 4 [Schistosoma japonicum]|uniref:Growth hormone-inducible transmembrane protein isoform 4 n=1 Tax=Schistosoma japonicum TaxID=6182 RepID=Q5DEG9_SCHJA|nr:SJCHGC09583 protein [Schistosoma japonicum]KAH8858479.1 Growth hormone-inducible transmembrane protein [Schistosoma japonicum]KAH8858483.1 Growth hormone-inducible transmembrane protein [Schistosoma japonicum]KAH8858485.1 Growth hormone-inducible transmembrane protein [Schistosoma japonicum]TNN16832.1 Growth hormone-inducible transmembrane protein isoform 4 [Schistosoma japonicum]
MLVIVPSLCRTHVLKLVSQLHSSTPFVKPLISKQHVRSFRVFPLVRSSLRRGVGRVNLKLGTAESQNGIYADKRRALVGAAAALGIGGLCLYGLAAKDSSLSTFDRSVVWPNYVKQRIRATYGYLLASVAITAGSTVLLFQSPTVCRLMLSGGWLAPIGMAILSITAGVICQSITYPRSGLNVKHLAWVAYSVSLGAMLMPVCLLGGPIIMRAAMYTGSIVGSLSLVAATAPSDRFIKWGGPLSIGLGVIFVSSVGSMFLSPVSRFGSGFASISLYGGLLLFSGFLLYDTQHVIKRAESHPPPSFYSPALPNSRGFQKAESLKPFDPINSSIRILLDAVNIFVRMVVILSGSGQRRK